MKGSRLLKFLTVLFTIAACSGNKKEVDISAIQIDYKFNRFELDLLQLKPQATPEKVAGLKKKYGVFFKRFNENIIQIGSADRVDYPTNIGNFIEDAAIGTVYEDVARNFASTEKLSEDFEAALKHYKYYFPNKVIPQVATFISGFNYPVAVTDSVLGIGLDMYLGKQYNYYKLMAMPQYQVDFMDKNYIVTDGMRSWLQTEFETMDAHNNLLSEMVFQGKLLYALEYILPEAEDSIRMEFTAKQLQWLNQSEAAVWAYFIDKNLFYSTRASENVKYINPAPFTAGMPKESPGRVGMWLGYKIVSSYMKHNSSLSLLDLMQEKDAQKILNKSRYKPKK
jgi:uncharacterized protein YjaZ